MALGGWILAGMTTTLALVLRHLLGVRMDAVARACHELRGPLTAARLGLQLGARSDELAAARLTAIDLELGRAARALDDLAEVQTTPLRSKPAALGPSCRTPIQMRDVVRDSVEAWRGAAQARGVVLAMRWTGAGTAVRGDRFRIAQATGNLIANAIEHGGGRVEVRGRAQRGRVQVEVIDSGPGLPAPVSELARSARRRGLGHGGGRRRGGRVALRGYGLAIAARVAEAHGGRLIAAPCEQGARLVLELPADGGEG